MQKVVNINQFNKILDLKESFFSLTVGAIVRLRAMKGNSITNGVYENIIEQVSNAGRNYSKAENSESSEIYWEKINLVNEQLNETKFYLRLAKLMVNTNHLQTALDQLIEKSEELISLSLMMKDSD